MYQCGAFLPKTSSPELKRLLRLSFYIKIKHIHRLSTVNRAEALSVENAARDTCTARDLPGNDVHDGCRNSPSCFQSDRFIYALRAPHPNWLHQRDVDWVWMIHSASNLQKNAALHYRAPECERLMSSSTFRLQHGACFDPSRLTGQAGFGHVIASFQSSARSYDKRVYHNDASLHVALANTVKELSGNQWRRMTNCAIVKLISSVLKQNQGFTDDHLNLLNPIVEEAVRVDRLVDYTPQQLTSLIHSISLLGSKCTTTLDGVMQEVGKPHRLEAMDAIGLSIIVYSMGITNFRSDRCVKDILHFATKSETLASMSTQGLCMVLTGLGRLGIHDSDVMLPVLREAAIPPRLASMQVKDFLGLLHACGRTNLHKDSQTTVNRIVHSLAQRGMSDVSNRDFVNLLRGLALCKYTSANMLESFYIEVATQARMSSYEAKDLSSICWVMASTGVYRAKLFEQLVTKYYTLVDFQSKIMDFQIGIGQLVHACAQFRYKNVSMFQSLWLAMLHNPGVAPFQLAQFVWMLCVVGCIRKDQYSKVSTVLGDNVKFESEEMHKKFLQFARDIDIHVKARGWKSDNRDEFHHRHPSSAYPNGQYEEPIANKFISDIGVCLRALKMGGWYVRLLGVVNGYVFAVPKNAILLPLQSSFYFLDLDQDRVTLKGYYAAKLEWLQKIGYKVMAE